MDGPTSGTRRIQIYDTTLRDGAQSEGVSFTLTDKIKITKMLDALGVDYIEGGYPLSNPKDAAYYVEISKLDLQYAKICAFGMTRRRGVLAEDDAGMAALGEAAAPVITIVGKTWDLHVDQVLGVSYKENLAMISESIAYCCDHSKAGQVELIFDAEHFFDGYRSNRDYSLQAIETAIDSGAGLVVLCDTNGGSLPGWISEVVGEVREAISDRAPLGIHCHNDSGVAVANSLAAVEAGAVHVQGTINGFGERCGNVDLTTIVANLRLKMGYECLAESSLSHLTETSRFIYETANKNFVPSQPFVGSSAFAHKGGMHVHAVEQVANSYEHVAPDQVGNVRRILISELSGASNISAKLSGKFDLASDKRLLQKVLERVQDLEHQGYQFEAATASFELLVLDILGRAPCFWNLDHYRCVILKRDKEPASTEAIVKLVLINGAIEHRVAEGDGPVNALDAALRKCLRDHYPQIADVHLMDYKVRVVNPTAESAAKVRVIAEFAIKPGNNWSDHSRGSAAESKTHTATDHIRTIGVNENIVDASWQAIADAFRYYLVEVDSEPGNHLSEQSS